MDSTGIFASRFFAEITEQDAASGKLTMYGEDVKHIRSVLRKRVGDLVILCDGQGTDFICEIAQMEKDSIGLNIADKYHSTGESAAAAVTLYQGLPKGDKIELVVQKCTEVGVTKIVPMICERTQYGMETVQKGKGENKRSRWQRIAMESAKQSGRGIIPEIAEFTTFRGAIDALGDGHCSLIPYEKCKDVSLRKALQHMKNDTGQNVSPVQINVFIGPEGGFSESEITLAVSQNVMPVTLGPRILRTETAGIVVIAAIMYEYDYQ